MSKRGTVVPLTADERVQRYLYLAGHATIDTLDAFVRKDGAPIECPTIYYRLNGYNGGKDPTAPDPATRWYKRGSSDENVTCDCTGGMSWGQGFDRYQPERMGHVYEGWINTDSMRSDAAGRGKGFVRIYRPEPGAIVVYGAGDEVGHTGGITAYNGVEWDATDPECWARISVVDVAARKGRANLMTTGRAWYGKDSWFLRSVMQP